MSELLRVIDTSLEDVMGDRFARYAKAIIQDRAIPDVRDGLKPVQRRILYGMYKDGNNYDKPTRKSAKTVGFIMGNFHPHGDSSIYDAMVRMSQWWKQSTPYIEMQGNNGSMDGDGAAAMRYTEARLSKISNELLKDIEKQTITWAPNFDDTVKEPTVLPAKFPNLLVNGANGISAGYATNIPPHNLGEVCDATIKRIDSPNCRLDTILEIVKGPDFPTGGIVEGKKGIIDAFSTGRGKVIVRAKSEFIKNKGNEQIVISEIPFDVNKAMLVHRIADLSMEKKLDGILEVRDESDRKDPVRIVIDLKKGANKELILNYLYKNSDLQISYNYNMVAIVNKRPMTLGILQILDAYIAFQKEVITKRTQYDLNFAKERMHIVEGLIKAISILDEIIATIRKSKNKADAKINLSEKYGFTERQSEYIVMLQLYRLTNQDIVELQEEFEKLKLVIAGLEDILADPEKLKGVMKNELKKIKQEYATPRKTEIKDEVMEISINEEDMIPREDVIVVITKDGYVKRVSKRSFKEDEEPLLKDNDYVLGFYELNTLDTVLLFTSLGNFIYVPVYQIPELKWKELGKHISNLVKMETNDEIISCIKVTNFDEPVDIMITTKMGMVKRTSLKEFKLLRYNKPVGCMKLKANDCVIDAFISTSNNIFMATRNGYGLWYDINEVPIVGLKASGVKGINLKDDYVVSVNNFGEIDYISIIMDRGNGKRVKLSEFEKSSRARRGLMLVRDIKSNPYKIVKTFTCPSNSFIGLITDEIVTIKLTELSISDRYSTGNSITKKKIESSYYLESLIKKENKNVVNIEKTEEKPKVSLKEIDERLMTIDDYI
jgi:topoisomerase-4 subunit A